MLLVCNRNAHSSILETHRERVFPAESETVFTMSVSLSADAATVQ